MRLLLGPIMCLALATASAAETPLEEGRRLMGEGRNVGQPVCRRADAQNVAMVLAVPNWRGEGLPDPTTLNGRARLAAWIWTRP